jgi:hypothetical protein
MSDEVRSDKYTIILYVVRGIQRMQLTIMCSQLIITALLIALVVGVFGCAGVAGAHSPYTVGTEDEVCTVMCKENRKKPRDRHCWDVNCRKKDPACPEACSDDGMYCLSVILPPCEIVCDKFCARGRLEKAQ